MIKPERKMATPLVVKYVCNLFFVCTAFMLSASDSLILVSKLKLKYFKDFNFFSPEF